MVLHRFSPNDTDTNWIESLPRADVPDVNAIAQPQPQRPRPSPKSPPPLSERAGTPASVSRSATTPLVNQQALDDLHNRLAEQRQVIASLQTENSTLRTSLTRLDEIQDGEWPSSISVRLLTECESRCSREGQSSSGRTGSL